MIEKETTPKNKEPIITWIPWKPVKTKKILPKSPSLILKKELKYSPTWENRKINPRIIVKTVNKKEFKNFIWQIK